MMQRFARAIPAARLPGEPDATRMAAPSHCGACENPRASHNGILAA